jgi:hypothetical protein
VGVRRFFYMQWRDSNSPTIASGELEPSQLRLLGDASRVVDWAAPSFTAVSPLVDYVVNHAVVRLCSPLLKEVIEEFRSDVDDVQWLAASVITQHKEPLPYYLLHFPTSPDLLDPAQTLMNGSQVIRPAVSLERASGHHVFGFNAGGNRTIVSVELRAAITTAGCTGVGFEDVRQV